MADTLAKLRAQLPAGLWRSEAGQASASVIITIHCAEAAGGVTVRYGQTTSSAFASQEAAMGVVALAASGLLALVPSLAWGGGTLAKFDGAIAVEPVTNAIGSDLTSRT